MQARAQVKGDTFEVKDHTIDKILEKDDLVLGLEVLSGKDRL